MQHQKSAEAILKESPIAESENSDNQKQSDLQDSSGMKNKKIDEFFTLSNKKRERDNTKDDIVIDLASPANNLTKSPHSPRVGKKKLKLGGNSNSDRSKTASAKKKSKINRDSCSICRDGGNLLLCDNCPKSFHPECLKIKKNDIPEGSWFCPGCIPTM